MKSLSIVLVLAALIWAVVASESETKVDVQQPTIERQAEEALPALVRIARQFGFGRRREEEDIHIEISEGHRRRPFGGLFGGRRREDVEDIDIDIIRYD